MLQQHCQLARWNVFFKQWTQSGTITWSAQSTLAKYTTPSWTRFGPVKSPATRSKCGCNTSTDIHHQCKISTGSVNFPISSYICHWESLKKAWYCWLTLYFLQAGHLYPSNKFAQPVKTISMQPVHTAYSKDLENLLLGELSGKTHFIQKIIQNTVYRVVNISVLIWQRSVHQAHIYEIAEKIHNKTLRQFQKNQIRPNKNECSHDFVLLTKYQTITFIMNGHWLAATTPH